MPLYLMRGTDLCGRNRYAAVSQRETILGGTMKLEEIFANAPTVIDQAQREHYYDQGYLVFRL